MMNWRTKQHLAKRQPATAVCAAMCALGLGLSAINMFGVRTGQTGINSRQLRQ